MSLSHMLCTIRVNSVYYHMLRLIQPQSLRTPRKKKKDSCRTLQRPHCDTQRGVVNPSSTRQR